MLGRIAAAVVLIALAGCAGMESAGRSAERAPATPRVASAPPPPAAASAPLSPPPAAAAVAPAPSAAETPPSASADPAPPAQADPPVATAARSDDNTVVVPGVRERQVQAPDGDPRSNAERMQDIRAWDRCVMRAQAAGEADPLRPQLVMPEDYCRESLGMANRLAVPASRLERQR